VLDSSVLINTGAFIRSFMVGFLCRVRMRVGVMFRISLVLFMQFYILEFYTCPISAPELVENAVFL